MVGLSPDHATRYPHEFSGGQRQRIGIARALAVDPRLIVADEPVSALDVSIQAQIVNLLRDLQQRLKLALLFIAHDLAIVEHISDRVAVMYRGRIVEIAAGSALYSTPRHPYTVALLSAILAPDPDRRRARLPPANEAVHGSAAAACPFHPRCPMARDRCRIDAPQLREVAPGHWSACHFAEGAAGLRTDDAPVRL
jgi:oligopeptide/dipeptide ABC transporter ATP-binding protein